MQVNDARHLVHALLASQIGRDDFVERVKDRLLCFLQTGLYMIPRNKLAIVCCGRPKKERKRKRKRTASASQDKVSERERE